MIINIGDKVKVDHPITSYNPEEYFTVVDIRIDSSDGVKASIRGENTCWFSAKMVIDHKPKKEITT